jgi:hypothetical protein
MPTPPTDLEAAVHLIQIALTPVFLLSGIAALLNVFAGRMARVADRLDHLSADLRQSSGSTGEIHGEIAALHKRSRVLDAAVVLGTAGATATCLNILTLFLLALSDFKIGALLLLFFGLAILCTLGSVGAFGLEMLMSANVLRLRMHGHVPTLALTRRQRRQRA